MSARIAAGQDFRSVSSPDQAIPEDLRRFQLHQTRAGVRPPSINGSVAALRFFPP
jgi:hypothetical protein